MGLHVEIESGYHPTEVYQKAMRTRQGSVEPLLAETKDWHRLTDSGCLDWSGSTARRCSLPQDRT